MLNIKLVKIDSEITGFDPDEMDSFGMFIDNEFIMNIGKSKSQECLVNDYGVNDKKEDKVQTKLLPLLKQNNIDFQHDLIDDDPILIYQLTINIDPQKMNITFVD